MNREITQKLCEVAEITMGQSPESESYNDKGDGIPFYQGKSDFGEVYPTVRMYCTSPKKIAMADDILMSVRAPIGDVNIAQEKCCIGRGLAAIRPKGNTNLKYLFYLLDYYKERLAEQGTGSTFKAISKDILNELHIPIWPLGKQKWIADVIDEIQTIIFNRKETLSILDELVKSRFVEMFGDPVTNPMGWKVTTVGQVTTDVRYGTSAKANDDGQYKYLRMNNLTYDGYLDLSDLKHIDVSDEELEKCVVRKGDVLFNRTNSTELVGKTALFDLDEDMVIAGYIIRVRLHDIVSPVFFTRFMNMEFMKKQLRSMAKGAVNQANINAQELKAIAMYVPPIELQNEFADFVKQADKSKLAVQQSIETLQTLKAKLMQDYFG